MACKRNGAICNICLSGIQKSFSAAAKTLYVWQPALRAIISRLEVQVFFGQLKENNLFFLPNSGPSLFFGLDFLPCNPLVL